MSIEAKINYQLNKLPVVKKVVKRVYQYMMYMILPKTKSYGNLVCISPRDQNYEYFFGYYDKSPWDATDRYMLCLKATDTWNDVSPRDIAEILLIDTKNHNKAIVIAKTHSWNVQQGCMLQWLGPDYASRILYNDYRDGKYCSVILTLATKEEKIVTMPVYTVSTDGTFALTLDFSRLHRLRPGYGYYNVPDKTENEKLPNKTCIWRVDINSGEVTSILKYTDFANFEPRPEMDGAEHKVNHIMLSPNGKRFMVLHRWFNNHRKYTRLITCNVNGTDMYNLSDDNMVSHCCWKTNNQILAFENKKQSGSGYYLMKDKTRKFKHFWPRIDYDGHPSYSPDGNMIMFDRYPDKARVASVMVSNSKNRRDDGVKVIAKVFTPFKYDNDTRCDLHPRWNRVGNKICFDSVFEGRRGLYIVELDNLFGEANINKENIDSIDYYNKDISKKIQSRDDVFERYLGTVKYSIVTPVYNSFNMMDRYFSSLNRQTFKDFEIIIIDDNSSDETYRKLLALKSTSKLRINVIQTKKNLGPGHARNLGIMMAKGKWITFIDSDDWVEDTLLEEIDEVINKNDVHCIIYDLYMKSEKKQFIVNSMYKGEEGICSIPDCLMYTRNHSVGKFYNVLDCKDNNIWFPELRRCEDIGFTSRAIEACGSVYYYKKPLYYYYQRASSLSNNNHLDESDMVKAFTMIENSLGNKYPRAIEGKSVTDLLYGGVLMMCKANKDCNKIKEYIIKYEMKYPNWNDSPIISCLGNKKYFLKYSSEKNIMMLKLMTFVHTLIIKRYR